jgi:hypothetical protein
MRIVTVNDQAKLITGGPYAWDGEQPPAGYVSEEWALANGYTYPGPDPVPVPESVEAWKFRAVCEQQGLTVSIETFIASQNEPPRIALENFWRSGTEVPRHNDMVKDIAEALGKTEAQIDALFIAASQIQIS